MREEFDFLAVNWKNWTTNGLREAVRFTVAVCQWDAMKGLFPPFSFRMETECADATALRLHELFEARVAFRMNNGPLGGGLYLVEKSKWDAAAGSMTMLDTRSGSEVTPPPVIAKPANFTLLLTGPPDVADLFPGSGK